MYKIGLLLYDNLAGKKNIKKHQWLGKLNFHKRNPQLKQKDLQGGFIFYDGQMNDFKLGCWVAEQAIFQGVIINERSEALKISEEGHVLVTQKKGTSNMGNGDVVILEESFDFVINATGSHVAKLLINSGIKPKYEVDHVRGSHLIIDRPLEHGYIFEVPDEKRFFFVLPYENKTLIGTTEVRQTLSEKIQCSEKECIYLINAYNHYFSNPIYENDVIESFAGLRPLIKSNSNPTKVSREYEIQQNKKLITIYGGKWTTARALAKQVCNKIALLN